MSRQSERRKVEIPARALPVLAIRDQVHFPGLINTVHVVREWSLAAANRALSGDRLLLVVSQRDMSLEQPGAEDLATIGTISEILHSGTTPDNGLRLVLRGLGRVRLDNLAWDGSAFEALPTELHERRIRQDERWEVLTREILTEFNAVAQGNALIPPEAIQAVNHLERPGELADTVAHFLPLRTPDKQQVLEHVDPVERLEYVLRLVAREHRIGELQDSIRVKVDAEVGDAQRQFYLREQLRIIQRELAEPDEHAAELAEYEELLANRKLPDAIHSKAIQELARLGRFPVGSSESGQIRTYLDLLLELPWGSYVSDRLDLREAEAILDREHYGLGDVKERVLEFLAVAALRGSGTGGALCFVGPPGVGKTGFARALAATLGRPWVRVALGGVRDEADIRGHRRTYIGAMPGRIALAMRQAGAMNPVLVLDEVDKMAMEMRGDPAAALLEALDPEQNAAFRDHFLEVSLDLSQVVFVATANTLDTLPGPLRDRMETIYFEGYTDRERVEIARRFLIPRALTACGLPAMELVSDAELEQLVRREVREPGVRGLDRAINRLCRRKARALASGQEPPEWPFSVPEGPARIDAVGVAWGLAVGLSGGTPLRIEAVQMSRRSKEPAFTVTGNLGEVMQESAITALSAVRIAAPADYSADLHLHVPEGAIPKDGPSAGLAMAASLASAVLNRPLRSDTAISGEITLTGEVLAVGSIREKILAAKRGEFSRVVIPKANEGEIKRFPPEVLEGIQVLYATHIGAALEELLV